MLLRKEVLASLQHNARLVREGKEQCKAECKVLRMEAKILLDQINGERIALVQAEGEKKEALGLMKEVSDKCDKMAKEMQLRIAGCACEAEATKQLKEVADKCNRMAKEIQSQMAGCKARKAEAMRRMNQVLGDKTRHFAIMRSSKKNAPNFQPW
jgi:hypothetical protein